MSHTSAPMCTNACAAPAAVAALVLKRKTATKAVRGLEPDILSLVPGPCMLPNMLMAALTRQHAPLYPPTLSHETVMDARSAWP
jgi:hypothetical protein